MKREKGKGGHNSKTNEKLCYHCGGKGHWSHTYHTPKHLVELYQQSLKNKGKKIEIHFAYKDGDFDYGDIDPTHLNNGDFLLILKEKIDDLIADGSVKK